MHQSIDRTSTYREDISGKIRKNDQKTDSHSCLLSYFLDDVPVRGINYNQLWLPMGRPQVATSPLMAKNPVPLPTLNILVPPILLGKRISSSFPFRQIPCRYWEHRKRAPTTLRWSTFRICQGIRATLSQTSAQREREKERER